MTQIKTPDRRIAIRIDFKPTDRTKLSLAPDVSAADLAKHDLTGGEIKNVALNATSIAPGRGPKSRITAADFGRAIAMEIDVRWSSGRWMGFVASEATA